MTAEFAAVLPAVLLVLAIALGSLQVAGEQLRLQQGVADASRLLARGDDGAASLSAAVPNATLAQRRQGDLVCATATAPASFGVGAVPGIQLHASACALAGGR
ncbi:MAG: hypothetical protein JWQ12_2414 [Glaciihabitans sp.]|nr:hypothetical protein [Glaciihabitans sp.]